MVDKKGKFLCLSCKKFTPDSLIFVVLFKNKGNFLKRYTMGGLLVHYLVNSENSCGGFPAEFFIHWCIFQVNGKIELNRKTNYNFCVRIVPDRGGEV